MSLSDDVTIEHFIGPRKTWAGEINASPADPLKHTMTPAAYFSYIGRKRGKDGSVPANPYEIGYKKFSDGQKRLIEEAYKARQQIRVFGALKQHRNHIAAELKYKILEHSVEPHGREKRFNSERQTMWRATPDAGGPEELWVFVFPSAEYVDQVAELIQAIVTDFALVLREKNKQLQVFVQHFPRLEANVTTWTGFSDGIRPFIRYGDVIAIGHVSDFDRSLRSAGFRSEMDIYEPKTDGWKYFGLNGMFGSKILVSTLNSRRIVLVGFKESFWGSASGYYASALADAGARHILYGSKAATMINRKWITKVAAPKVFQLFHNETLTEPVLPEQSATRAMLQHFQIKPVTTALTVPTVIGETLQQAKQLEHAPGACMDCENGHIAEALRRFNDRLAKPFDKPAQPVSFFPVHFMTDYIHQAEEDDEKTEDNPAHVEEASPNDEFDPNDEGNSFISEAQSASDASNKKAIAEAAFSKIGAFFAHFAHVHGLVDSFRAPESVEEQDYDFSVGSVSAIYKKMRNGLRVGHSQALVTALLDEYRNGENSADQLLAISLTAQKCGYLNLHFAIRELFKLRPEFGGRNRSEFEIWFDVLGMKVCTQAGDFTQAKTYINKIEQRLGNEDEIERTLSKFDQYHAFVRRRKLIQVSDGLAISETIDSLSRFSLGGSPKYEYITAKFFDCIEFLMSQHSKTPENLNNISALLAKIRTGYYGLGDSRSLWMHAHREKGAIAASFLEAAFYLKGNREQQFVGLKKLLVAHLFNVRFGGNEKSEGYGEIVRAIGSPAICDLVSLAMRRDPHHQSIFQKYVSRKDSSAMRRIFDKCNDLFLEKDPKKQIKGLNALMKVETPSVDYKVTHKKSRKKSKTAPVSILS